MARAQSHWLLGSSGATPTCLLLIGLSTMLFACESTRITQCPKGFVPGGAHCVPADGGLDGGGDATVDAGPCSGACTGATPLCLEDAGTCVACLEDSDCAEPEASRCDEQDHTCKPCEQNAHCAGLTGKGVCNTRLSPAACVECTAQDMSACGDKICDTQAGACTDFAAGSAFECMPCVSDAHCGAGLLCMAMRFEDTDVGTYCLYRQDAPSPGPAGDCVLNGRPYVDVQESQTSLDGTKVTVCAPQVSTCEALEGTFREDCAASGAADQSKCGMEGLDDAWCQQVSAGAFRCTVPCLSKEDCPIGVDKCTFEAAAGRKKCEL